MEQDVHASHVFLEHPMEHLPSVEDAPILKELKKLGTEKFREEYAIPTPVYKNGLVNHKALVTAVQEYVDPDYKWLSPFLDEHHTNWPAVDYEIPAVQYESTDSDYSIIKRGRNGGTSFYKGDEIQEINYTHPEYQRLIENTPFEESMYDHMEILSQFRELAMNKLWVPRQFHNLLHLMTIPPDMPELSVMKYYVREQRRRQYLFEVANRAVQIREKLDRAEPIELSTGGTLLIDRKVRRTYHKPEEMLKHRDMFIRQILKHHRMGLIDLNEMLGSETVDMDSVESGLKTITPKLLGEDTVKTRMGSRAINVPLLTRPLMQSVWVRSEEQVA